MLAIVIPYFKLFAFKETLDSLVNQSDKNFKVYIGDDASPESPLSLLNEYENKIQFKYHRFKYNLGGASLVNQWDRCIGLTENEKWIMILGDDDYLDINVVQKFYDEQDDFNDKVGVVRFASQMVYENNKDFSEVYKHPVWENAKDSFYRKHKCVTRSSLSEHAFLKTQYLKHKFFDYPLAWFSDDRAWLDFSEDMPIYTINEAKVFIRISSESISGKQNNLEQKRRSSALFYNYLVNRRLERFSKPERNEIIKSYIERTLIIRNLKLKEWFFLFYLNLKNFNIKSIKKTSKAFLNATFNLKK